MPLRSASLTAAACASDASPGTVVAMAEPLDDLLVRPGEPARLPQRDPGTHPGMSSDEAGEALDQVLERLEELQLKLEAEEERSLLVVLQGMDASGKDEVIYRSFGSISGGTIDVHSFSKPEGIEAEHDFLWRFRCAVPPNGRIGVFDRSYLEEVVANRLETDMDRDELEAKFERITTFERDLVAAGTTVVQLFLHMSPETQRKRFLKRLDDPLRRWRFKDSDLDDRDRWDELHNAYEEALTRCSIPEGPWYVVPADDARYRNWVCAELVVRALEAMDLPMPEPEMDLGEARRRLDG
jgi:PPK2 family polyphosphate:nucleotide phosphotransferase